MSGLMCCIWWFVAGVLVGWLLSWFLSKFMGSGDAGGSGNSSRPMPAYAPPAPTMDPRLAMIAAAAAAGASAATGRLKSAPPRSGVTSTATAGQRPAAD